MKELESLNVPFYLLIIVVLIYVVNGLPLAANIKRLVYIAISIALIVMLFMIHKKLRLVPHRL